MTSDQSCTEQDLYRPLFLFFKKILNLLDIRNINLKSEKKENDITYCCWAINWFIFNHIINMVVVVRCRKAWCDTDSDLIHNECCVSVYTVCWGGGGLAVLHFTLCICFCICTFQFKHKTCNLLRHEFVLGLMVGWKDINCLLSSHSNFDNSLPVWLSMVQITLHYITINYIPLHHVTLHYIELHYVTLRYITLN